MLNRVHLLPAAVLAAGVLLAAALVPLPTLGQAAGTEAEEPRTISVNGRARLEVSPDTAQVTLGVSKLAESAATSYNQAAGSAQALIDALKAGGVAEAEMKTSNLSLHPEYEWTREQRVLVGYRTNVQVVVTTRNLESLGALIDAAVAAGANEIGNIAFLVKDEARHRDAALELAVADARHKAELVARELGAKVGKPLQVQIIDGGSTPPPVMYKTMAAEGDSGAAMPVMGGTAQYEAQVQVIFALE